MTFRVWTYQLACVFSGRILDDEQLEDSIVDTIEINYDDAQIARQLAEEGGYLSVSWGQYFSHSSILKRVWNIGWTLSLPVPTH